MNGTITKFKTSYRVNMVSLVKIVSPVVVLFLLYECDSIFAQALSPDKPIQVCGSSLSETLSLVCNGFYNTGKRGDIKTFSNDIMPLDYYYNHEKLTDADNLYPFIGKKSVSTVLKSIRSKRPYSIVDECCRKPCTVAEILGYCSN